MRFVREDRSFRGLLPRLSQGPLLTELPPDVTGKYGYMGHKDAGVLRMMASRKIPGRLLNVGCFKGLSCSILATVGEVDCVDPFLGTEDGKFRDYYSTWEANMKWCGVRDRITMHRSTSEKVLPTLPDASYRLVFIDGSHTVKNAAFDLAQAMRLVTPKGCVLFDDVDSTFEFIPDTIPVTKAANAIFGDRWERIPDTKLGMWFPSYGKPGPR